jgi:predicted ATPase/Tfp pilus assembly protein PilF/DNA-binding XRE family transcriptional regulator
MAILQLGPKIRELRKAAGLSQDTLASRAGIDPTYLSKLENNRQGASERVLTALATTLGVEAAQLLLLAGKVPDEMRTSLAGIQEPDSVLFRAPTPVTRFVGREREVDQIRELLRRGSPLTLSGPPGCGKSRLLAEVARILADEGSTVAWVTIPEGNDTEEIAVQIAERHGIEARSAAQLIRHLVQHAEVVVLDDADMSLSASSDFARQLLENERDITIVASSRQPLKISGEQLFRVAGLDAPDESAGLPGPESSLRPLLSYEAVSLFTDRAALADSDFELTHANAAAVARVCRQLDGLPLALELAAIRLQQMTVAELTSRLDDMFWWLRGNSRDVPPRHASLEAAIASSFDNLTVEQQEVAVGLSVFSGPFDLESALQVAAATPSQKDSVIQSVMDLGERSLLLRQSASSDRTTFRWPRPIREYCLRRLEDRQDSAEIWNRFADWGLRLIGSRQGEGAPRSPDEWARLVESAHDWISALGQLRTHDQFETLLPMVAQILPILKMDHLPEGWKLVEQLAGRATGPRPDRTEAIRSVAVLARRRGDFGAAEEYCSGAHRLYVEAGNRRGEAETLMELALIEFWKGDLRLVEAKLDAANLIYVELGDESRPIEVGNRRGLLRLASGDTDEAHRLFTDSLVEAERLEEMHMVADLLGNLGVAECMRYRLGPGRSLLRKSLAVRHAMRNKRGIAKAIEAFAILESLRLDFPLALQLLAAARQYRRSTHAGGISAWWDQLLSTLEEDAKRTIGSVEYQRNMALGSGLSLDEARDLASREETAAAIIQVVVPPLDLIPEVIRPHESVVLGSAQVHIVLSEDSREVFDDLLDQYRQERREVTGAVAAAKEVDAIWEQLDHLCEVGRLSFAAADRYRSHEHTARQLLRNDAADWSSVAVSITTGLAILTRHPESYDTSIPTLSMRRLQESLRGPEGQSLRRSTRTAAALNKSRAGEVVERLMSRDATERPNEVLYVGWHLHQDGDLDAARDTYERVIRSRDPEATPLALRNLGLLLERQGHLDQAVKVYQRAVESGHPDCGPRAGTNLGWLLAHLGRDQEAQAAYEAVIASKHADHAPKAQVNLSLLLERQGRQEEARELLREVGRSEHPRQSLRAKRHLARLLEKQGKVEQAVALLDQISKSGHHRQAAKAAQDLQHLREELGHLEEASVNWLPQTLLEQAILDGDEEEVSRRTTVTRELMAARVLALGEPAASRFDDDQPVTGHLLGYATSEDSQQKTIPVFTRDVLLVPSLLRNPGWRSLPVLMLDGSELIASLDAGECVVVNPGTPLEFRIEGQAELGQSEESGTPSASRVSRGRFGMGGGAGSTGSCRARWGRPARRSATS